MFVTYVYFLSKVASNLYKIEANWWLINKDDLTKYWKRDWKQLAESVLLGWDSNGDPDCY